MVMAGSGASSYARLCGELRVEIGGRRVDTEASGRQGRLLLAYLVDNRERQVGRDELLELLWPERRPPDPDAALRTQLSKLRRALGPEALEGKASLELRLPTKTTIDLEEAVAKLDDAERALAASDWRAARSAAERASDVTGGGFCVGLEGPWVEERREQIAEHRLRALECLAEASLGLGEAELGVAVDAAREIIVSSPLRETGQRLLMTALARRGSVPEAMRVFEDLRQLLREELGTAPSPRLVELHDRLLRSGALSGGQEAWVVVDPGSPREWVVQIEPMLLVGRECGRVDPSRRLVLDDPTVSREHLELRRDGEGGVVLVDLSTNGTRVNGSPVAPGAEISLQDRDVVELGNEKLLFRAPGAASPPADRFRTTLRN